MILGIGFDLVDLRGFREQLADKASRFVSGTFTLGEQEAASARPSKDRARHLGARFAAKEAFLKAWSTARRGEAPVLSSVNMREIEVVNDQWGRPGLDVHGAVGEAFAALGARAVHLSLTHDGDTAGAMVVVER